MNLLDMVMAARNGGAITQLAKNFGLGQNQTQGVIKQLLPMLARGLQNNASTPNGIESLLKALSSGQHEQYLNHSNRLGNPSTTSNGNAILGHIFGNKDVSRNVAAHAAAKSGVPSLIVKKMLPVIATMAMGALSRKAGTEGLLGNTSSLNGNSSSTAMDLISSLLDSDKDGSIADDLLSLATKLF